MRIISLLCLMVFSPLAMAQNLEYSALLLDKTFTDNANAVVRLDDMAVTLNSRREMTIRLHRIVTVLNKYGAKHVHASVGYNNSVKVKKIQATVYDGFGKELEKFKKKEFRDVSAVDGGTLYSDSRVLYMDYTPIQYPYTVDFTYEIATPNTSNVPNWFFLDGFLVSSEKSRFSVTFNSPELKPTIKEKNLEDLKVNKTEEGNSITYEAEGIKAIKNENLSPSFGNIAPMLMVRTTNFHYEGYDGVVSNWNDLGAWMHSKLLKDRDGLSEATKQGVMALVNGVDDPLEKAKLVYRYVQENTRYISVQVGVGGIQPISAIEVDRVKYGDCKGLTNYTKTLLEYVGVPSYYTHVEAGRYKVNFEDDFADLAQGNHVILAIPYEGKYHWIDCTSQSHPFGFIGDFTDGRKVLVIKPNGGELTTTTAYLNEENYQKTMASFALDVNGSISGDITINTGGIQYDNRFYLENRKEDDVIKHYQEYWDNINNLKVGKHQFVNDKENVVFTEKIAIKAVNYATKSGERILFAANAFNKSSYVPNRYRNRKMPLEIQRGYFDEDEFTIALPQGYAVEALPNATKLENEFGAYEVSVTLNEAENTVVYKRSLLIKEGLYPKEKYSEYRKYRKEVAKMDNAQIVLIKQ
ncbi:DUF3857 domain-containing protein [Spongiimicrobium salis]|uniref:DUF3857 domain-containing protein n=1 Tax=Spongiimicrobium salis TaxID=1667022 RepID=UPI00374D38A4